ncbi:uncharacterized protein LOC135469390 [Liolophura sinensis]|uniref:uncharacterized protein LOC135469390 n=1 Tax=Liolophura sinensis TaxID=3198878 RepID=UPI0031592F37
MNSAVAFLFCGLVAYGSASTCENICTPVCTGGTAGGGALIGDIPGAIIGGALSGTCSPVCHKVCSLGKRNIDRWFETVFPPHLTDYDLNGDGQISLKEFAAGFKGSHLDFATRHIFHLSDKDADGFLSALELALAPPQVQLSSVKIKLLFGHKQIKYQLA